MPSLTITFEIPALIAGQFSENFSLVDNVEMCDKLRIDDNVKEALLKSVLEALENQLRVEAQLFRELNELS